MKIKNLAIKGEKQATVPEAPANLTPLASYKISGSNRDLAETHTIDLNDNDKLLEFVFEDDTTWMCDGATLHELFPEAEDPTRSAGDAFILPGSIKTVESDRGIFGDIALKILNVFVKKKIDDGVANIATKLEDKHLGVGEGLYKVDVGFNLSPFTKIVPNKPVLLFIHGTNSSTAGAFSELAKAEVWNFIFSTYGDNVLAFQHRTLTKSPLQNVLDLIKQLPDTEDLHIISHSRGGIVGDILCRYTSKQEGFSSVNIDLLKKEGGRDNDIETIKQLNTSFLNRNLKVKKFIRVGCPAAGTKLASKKLEHILNVLFNLFGGAANPFADTLKELFAEVIRTKVDVSVLPGVEAQSPDSPFIKILNDRSDEMAIDGSSLAVIAGNGTTSISFKGLLVILGKLFYWQRNDLVVNTDSMYLGANRTGNIQYFFDQGAEVDHVKYFLNNKTREALLLALKTADGQPIPGYNAVPQHEIPASDRGEVRGFEHGDLLPYPNVPSGKKPIVILLPGIMGSNLTRNGDKIWLAYIKSVFGGLTDMLQVDDKTITATSLIKTSYKRLADRLSYKYDVVVYPFDWRHQLNDCARELNDTISGLLKYNQPIKMIGHSMGGLLIRDFVINYDDTWKQLNASKGFKILFLGSPLGGSHRILTVLFGMDSIINSLNFLDRVHTKKELLEMFCGFPGILSLLPLSTDKGNDFADTATWESMRNALGDGGWPLPGKSYLDTFKNYRDNIIAKRDGIDYSNMTYIAGKDKATPCGYFTDVIPPRTELVFVVTGEGDQSVTWESGIPQQLIDKKAVYYVNASHGALANEPTIFDGIEEILETGATTLLSTARPAVRGEAKVFRMPEVYNFDVSERGLEAAVFGNGEDNEPIASQVPIAVSVSNGDLAYASFPVLAGHFNNDGILYAEKSIDCNLNWMLSARHKLGLYPGEIGTNSLVLNNAGEYDFAGAIIVGLGDPGSLTGYLLTKTVEQGIAKYLLHINNGELQNNQEIGISALIIGSGYGGLSVESSIKAIVEGVNIANSKVTAVFKNTVKTIQRIEFIELFEDRALSCMYAISKLESKDNKAFNVRIGSKKIKTLFGSQTRLITDPSDEWWNRITVRLKKVKEGTNDVQSLLFSASTGDAREEERELFSSTPLIDLFIDQVSTQNNWNACAAKTIFELMIPNEFKERLKKKGNISWILDTDTAAYPWELLQYSTANAKPLCVDAGMIRQLATSDYRVSIKRVAGEKALIIGDPLLNGFVNQLPGAVKEAKAVETVLSNNGYIKTSLINTSAAEIITSFFCDDYKIIHLAGHGAFNPASPRQSGMVIGNGEFLTTFDIEQMSTIPELVFVNCCHLGKTSGVDEKFFEQRYKLAANIGTELIGIGVKAVVAAGWAVNDDAAMDFAQIFYARMFGGYSFGEAVRDARSAIYEKYHQDNNTWGSYQCYGDPFYRLVNRTDGKKESKRNYLIAREVEIDLHNLRNSLDIKSTSWKNTVDRLALISAAKDKAEIVSSEITETEAAIYFELAEYELAIEKFEALKNQEDATFSVASLEKYCNARCKKYVEDFKGGAKPVELIKKLNNIIGELNELLKINATAERKVLQASASKRKGLITKDAAAKLQAYKDAIDYYSEAVAINKNASYAFNHMLIFASVLFMIENTPAKQMKYGDLSKVQVLKAIAIKKKALQLAYRNMDYWDIIDEATYDLSLLFLDKTEAQDEKKWNSVEDRFRQIWRSAGSLGKKKAELENFEIVSDMLSLSTDKGVLFYKEKIDGIKERLEKEVVKK
jgi:pimeloyl-ACP methyl ester carboxylesterase/tetratricopeptide (TPR) repeat protein